MMIEKAGLTATPKGGRSKQQEAYIQNKTTQAETAVLFTNDFKQHKKVLS